MVDIDVMERAKKTHHTYWKFHKFLKSKFGEGREDFDDKLVGYDVIKAIEAYERKNKDIVTARVDDDYHASSLLVFVPHYEMGITVLFIPQCTTIANKFFLYPNFLQFVREGLEKAEKLAKIEGHTF